MYNATFFFQAVRLESAGQASTHLAVPSIAFTAVSAVSGTTIARLGTPKPTLRVSQLLLLAGTCGLVVMATVLPAVGAPPALYNLCLALPALGVGMMAPSALLTLLSLTDHETHAVANGGFIMMRSLGVFAATSLSSATIQNTFRARERVYGITEEKLQVRRHVYMVKASALTPLQKLEMARLNIDTLQTLEGDLQSLGKHIYPRETAHAESDDWVSCEVISARLCCSFRSAFYLCPYHRAWLCRNPRGRAEGIGDHPRG